MDGAHDSFTSSHTQSVQHKETNTIITVSASIPECPKMLPLSRNEVSCRDVETTASEIAADTTDLWIVAKALEQFVFQRVTTKGGRRSFANATETLKSGYGDCSEHAVLLAELCRARGIPSRTVLGLAHVKREIFGLHLWNEVQIQGAWRGLDATMGRGGIPATHLKLTHSTAPHPTELVCDAAMLNLSLIEIECISPDRTQREDPTGGEPVTSNKRCLTKMHHASGQLRDAAPIQPTGGPPFPIATQKADSTKPNESQDVRRPRL